MAKQLVNPIERHVEKGVLGLAALLLIGAVGKYLASTPNQLELGNEVVTPSNIDEKLAQKAADVRQRLATAKPKDEPDPVPPKLDATLAMGALRAAAPFLPPVPIVDQARVFLGNAKLIEVVAPGPVRLTVGRTTIELPTDWPGYADVDGKLPTDWVTVSTIFERAKQSADQVQAYGGTREKVLFAGVELQRRVRRPDGSWSNNDWQAVEPWPAPIAPPLPPVPLEKQDGKTIIRRESHQNILKFIEEFTYPHVQLDQYRPMMHKRVNGDCWVFPLFDDKTGERDVIMQDDEVLFPNQAPAAKPQDRYPCTKKLASANAAPKVSEQLDAIELQLADARKVCSEAMAKEVIAAATAYRDAADATNADRTHAEKLIRDANILIGDIINKICKGAAGATGKKARELLPRQQVWAIDGKPGSLTAGQAYQYRLRTRVLNPRLGEPAQFGNPEDATVPYLYSPWSAPSDVVTIEPMTYFFVTGSNPDRGAINVELFQWTRGLWLKPKSRLQVTAGDRVADESRVDAPDPRNPAEILPTLVSFNTGMRVVDIDFKRSFRTRKVSGKGVKFDGGESLAVLLVDERGNLVERFESLDRDHPARKAVQQKLWKPERP